MEQPIASRAHLREVLLLVALFSAFTLILKLPSLRFTHNEADEVVYWSVAQNFLENGVYTLRGAEITRRLSPAIYDRPLFHHPPLYPLLLTPFVALETKGAAIVISWLGHLLCVLSVGIIGWSLLDYGERAREVLWLALLGVATDPLLVLVSRKLWIDSLLAGLVALALALVWAAGVSPRRRLLLVLGGLVLGLAGLAKLPGLLGAPVAAMIIWGGGGTRRERLRDLLLVATPCAIVVVPWVVLFVATYGVPMPTWLKPDDYALRHYPFLAAAVGRPWYYYAAELALAVPASVAGLALSLRPTRGAGRFQFVAAAWLLIWLLAYTTQSATGHGFLMRYLAPIAPAIYVMLLGVVNRNSLIRPAIAVFIAYGAIESTVYLLTERFDELVSFPELSGLLRF